MTEIQIASNEEDARAATAVEAHHALMSGTLHQLTEALVGAVAEGEAAVARARYALVEWCDTELLPHAKAEERALYPAARATREGRLLVDSMLGEHEDIGRLVQTVAATGEPVRAAGAAMALRALFESHLAKENQLVMPLLAGLPDVSLTALLAGVHEVLGASSPAAMEGCTGHACACGEESTAGAPELDARGIPHAIRHATVLGALDAVVVGEGMVLVAPHDPLPLLKQVERTWPGVFAVEYLQRGPEDWRLLLTRSA